MLTSKETDSAFRKEKDQGLRKAGELARELDSFIRAFNRSKSELGDREFLIRREHGELMKELEREKEELKQRITKLEKIRASAMQPLYEKEKFLVQKERDLSKKEEVLNYREETVNVWGYEHIRKKEEEIAQRENNVVLREEQFQKFRQGQEGLLSQSKDKLRQWLEKERGLIRKPTRKLNLIKNGAIIGA